MRRSLAILALLIAVSPAPTFAQIGDEILPPAFTETLLELPDDAAQAAKSGKRLLLYFGQQGCPYCKELMTTSFTQKDITDKVAKHFVANSLNRIIDRAIQVHGALGYSTDTPLAHMYQHARWARFADGADEVHQMRIAQRTIAAYQKDKSTRAATGNLPV